MPAIQLSSGKDVHVSDEDYAYLCQWTWGELKGTYTTYAARGIRIDGIYQKILMHRVIAERMGLDIDFDEIDHKDGNGLNDRRSNLQVLTKSYNQHKSRIRSDSTTGVRGINQCRDSGLYIVRIQVEGKRYHVGRFSTIEEAISAREQAEIQYLGSSYGQT